MLELWFLMKMVRGIKDVTLKEGFEYSDTLEMSEV